MIHLFAEVIYTIATTKNREKGIRTIQRSHIRTKILFLDVTNTKGFEDASIYCQEFATVKY